MPETSVRLTAAQAGEWEIAAKAILCDCGCHPQSVKDCACGRAAEMRDEIGALIAQGQTGSSVIATYVARNGEQILVAPKAEGFNLIAWVGPVAALFVAAAILVAVLTRGRSKPPAAAAAATYDPEPDDSYAARLEGELREYDR